VLGRLLTAIVVMLAATGCAAAAAALPTVRVTGRFVARHTTSSASVRDARSQDLQGGIVLVWSGLPTVIIADALGATPVTDAAALDCAGDPLCAWTMQEACDAYARLEGEDPRCPVSSP
jgi:hypothetical protein